MRMMMMMKICALLLTLTIDSSASSLHQSDVVASEELSKRVIGGFVCAAAERQYHVELEATNTKKRCGGSLLSPRWVITAAHCAVGRQVTVKIGVHVEVTWFKKMWAWMTTPEKQDIPVTQQYGFKSDDKNHDIMLLRLTKDVSANYPTIHLPAVDSCTPPAPDKLVRIGGWGAMSESQIEKKQPSKLLCATVPVKECKDIDQDEDGSQYHRDAENTICAFKSGVDVCPGDAGSAVEFDDKLYGVINSNPIEKCDHTVDIANICHYIAWIDETMLKYDKVV